MNRTNQGHKETTDENPENAGVVEKIKVDNIQINKPHSPDVTPEFIGWAKKGKDSTCS